MAPHSFVLGAQPAEVAAASSARPGRMASGRCRLSHPDAKDGGREPGRVIGLVSHVHEAKSGIPRRIRVHRSPRGPVVSVLTRARR